MAESAVYDPAEGALILIQSYCGSSPCPSILTWEYKNGNWSLVHTPHSPGARADESIVYDSADNYLLMYGGEVGESDSTTWEFANHDWTNITTNATGPGPLWGEGLADDVTDGYVVMLGGLNESDDVTNGTWIFSGGSWSMDRNPGLIPNVTAFNEPDPMVFDAALNSVVLFSGGNSTYLFQHGRWTEVHAPIPDSLWRGDGSVAYDPRSGSVLYVGGLAGCQCSATNETLSFNGSAWIPITTTTSAPPSFEPVLAYDPAVSGILLFGGGSIGAFRANDTWVFGAGEVSFTGEPASGGSVQFRLTTISSGNSSWLPFGQYVPRLLPNSGYHGGAWNYTGNLSEENGSYLLSGNATVFGTFLAQPRVDLSARPSTCSIEFNGTAYPSGTDLPFNPGLFPLTSPGCPHVEFKRWAGSPNASIASVYSNSTTVTLTGSSSITAVFVASVNFQVYPASVGSLVFNGTLQVPDSPQEWLTGNYSVAPLPAPGWKLDDLATSGSIELSDGIADVQGSGTINGTFVPYPTVRVDTSLPQCETVGMNETNISSGGGLQVFEGKYGLTAPVCPDALFDYWSVTGDLTISSASMANTTIYVFGNGTLVANYAPAAWVRLLVSPAAAMSSISWNGSVAGNGSYFETRLGFYSIVPLPTTGWELLGWTTRGGAAISNTTLNLTSNATITAEFGRVPNPGQGTGPYALLGLAAWEWEAILIVTGAAVAGTAAFYLRRRRFQR